MARSSHIRRLALTTCALLLASACAREPSEADIRQATETMLTSSNANPFTQPAADLAGTGGKAIEIHRLHKLGCTKFREAHGYRCDIELEVTTFGMPQQDRSSVRMVRGKDGWVAMRR